MNELSCRLKRLRVEKKMTQEGVAEALFVSRQAVSNWETGKNNPDLVSIVLLSKIYKVSLDELL